VTLAGMHAMTITEFGPADALAPRELPAPEPAAGEVSIDVTHAGVNFAEVLFRQGLVDVPLPYVPGIEVAGTVRALGPGVDHLQPGQPVAALTIIAGGGYGAVAVTDARLAVPLPAGLSPALAAAAPANTTTAFLVLEEVARLRRGERVLVHAAAGGVGSQLGQVAKLLGAGEVVGIVGRPEKVAAARRYGYDDVWLRDDWSGGGFDVVIDQVGGAQRQASLAALAPLGRLVAMGNASGADDVAVSANELWLTSRAVMGFNLRDLAEADPERVGRALPRALTAVAAGEVRIEVEELPLAAAADAHRRLEAGATTGKLVFQTPAASPLCQ
jgi:NADPH2:quinone reductase